jgi:hypothetical protein
MGKYQDAITSNDVMKDLSEWRVLPLYQKSHWNTKVNQLTGISMSAKYNLLSNTITYVVYGGETKNFDNLQEAVEYYNSWDSE